MSVEVFLVLKGQYSKNVSGICDSNIPLYTFTGPVMDIRPCHDQHIAY